MKHRYTSFLALLALLLTGSAGLLQAQTLDPAYQPALAPARAPTALLRPWRCSPTAKS
jgi:hypothetical protein